jgi:hypothetical protein
MVIFYIRLLKFGQGAKKSDFIIYWKNYLETKKHILFRHILKTEDYL